MSIADTRRFWEILVIAVLQILEDSGKYWLYQYCRYWKILENIGYTSIAEPVFPRIFWYLQYSYFGNDQYLLVLQILENSGRYWDTSIYQYLYQYCRYWKILVRYW
jgi:hypothetical protein